VRVGPGCLCGWRRADGVTSRAQDEEEGEGEKAEQGSDSDDASSDDEDEEEAVKPAPSKAAKPVAALIEEDGMDWEGEVTKALTGENKEGAGAKAEEQDAKKSKREKKRAKEAREETVAAAEQVRLSLLFLSPNESTSLLTSPLSAQDIG
jgi:hypothetical protein